VLAKMLPLILPNIQRPLLVFTSYFRAMENSPFSHISDQGDAAMVDVSKKSATTRSASASASVRLPENVTHNLVNGELHLPKGPVFQTARIAGIMAAKRTAELIPLCHPLPIDHITVDITMNGFNADILTTVTTTGKTGVEMEALTAASVAALTIYDMCKALAHDIVIGPIQLMEKTGGKNDYKRHA
jgi:cyclic pyranopterin phosphate synthase